MWSEFGDSAFRNQPSHFDVFTSRKTVTQGKQTLPLKLTATSICAWSETQHLPAIIVE